MWWITIEDNTELIKVSRPAGLSMKDFFWLTAVPLPHAGYVFIYVAFTTDLLQIF
jgi:hypothetical protein